MLRPQRLRSLLGTATLLVAAPAFGESLVGDTILIEQHSSSLGTIRSDSVVVVAGSPEITCPGAFDLCGANVPGSGGNFDVEATTLSLNNGPGPPTTFLTFEVNDYPSVSLTGTGTAVLERTIGGRLWALGLDGGVAGTTASTFPCTPGGVCGVEVTAALGAGRVDFLTTDSWPERGGVPVGGFYRFCLFTSD